MTNEERARALQPSRGRMPHAHARSFFVDLVNDRVTPLLLQLLAPAHHAGQSGKCSSSLCRAAPHHKVSFSIQKWRSDWVVTGQWVHARASRRPRSGRQKLPHRRHHAVAVPIEGLEHRGHRERLQIRNCAKI